MTRSTLHIKEIACDQLDKQINLTKMSDNNQQLLPIQFFVDAAKQIEEGKATGMDTDLYLQKYKNASEVVKARVLDFCSRYTSFRSIASDQSANSPTEMFIKQCYTAFYGVVKKSVQFQRFFLWLNCEEDQMFFAREAFRKIKGYEDIVGYGESCVEIHVPLADCDNAIWKTITFALVSINLVDGLDVFGGKWFLKGAPVADQVHIEIYYRGDEKLMLASINSFVEKLDVRFASASPPDSDARTPNGRRKPTGSPRGRGTPPKFAGRGTPPKFPGRRN